MEEVSSARDAGAVLAGASGKLPRIQLPGGRVPLACGEPDRQGRYRLGVVVMEQYGGVAPHLYFRRSIRHYPSKMKQLPKKGLPTDAAVATRCPIPRSRPNNHL